MLGQDVANFERAHRGMHQPGMTHLTVSPIEECRLINLHRNLEDYLDIEPTELVGAEQVPRTVSRRAQVTNGPNYLLGSSRVLRRSKD